MIHNLKSRMEKSVLILILTTPACPLKEKSKDARKAVLNLPGVNAVNIRLMQWCVLMG